MPHSVPEYDVIVDRDVMVPMRDGVRLVADIYWPAIDGERVDGPLPTILGRTSYDKTWPELWVAPVADYFAPRGYAVVLQDQRDVCSLGVLGVARRRNPCLVDALGGGPLPQS